MSNTYTHEFEHRVLYEQRAVVEENKYIHCRTYACSYMYPGALSRATCRVRTTVICDNTVSQGLTVSGGTIEKWSDRGWLNVEEYFDSESAFITSEEALDHMLNMFKSFILGITSEEDKTPAKSPPPKRGPKGPKKDPFLRVLSFKDAKKPEYNKYIKEEKEKESKGKKKDDDSPDFDWI